MTSQPPNNLLERKILFFRADIGFDDGGVPLEFDPLPTLTAIGVLPFTDDDQGRYEAEVDGNALCLIIHHLQPMASVRFCRVRRTGLPQLEQAGLITDLDLTPESGLLESIHVTFFPNNIVGAEYNHFGPRISRLGSYLHSKSQKAAPRATFRPLLRGDATAQLDRLTDLRLLEISVLPSIVEITRQSDDSLADALEANARAVETPKTLQAILKPLENAQTSFLSRKRGPLKEMVGNESLREGSAKFQVRGKCADSGRVETIDLLKDQLISTQGIVRMNERSRALNPDSAFEAIRESYELLKDELEEAAGVSV